MAYNTGNWGAPSLPRPARAPAAAQGINATPPAASSPAPAAPQGTPPTWQQVLQMPQMRGLSADQLEAARNQYFIDVVAPRVPTDQLEAARAAFDADTAPGPVHRTMNAVSDAMQKLVGDSSVMAGQTGVASPAESQASPVSPMSAMYYKRMANDYLHMTPQERTAILDQIDRTNPTPAGRAFLKIHEDTQGGAQAVASGQAKPQPMNAEQALDFPHVETPQIVKETLKQKMDRLAKMFPTVDTDTIRRMAARELRYEEAGLKTTAPIKGEYQASARDIHDRIVTKAQIDAGHWFMPALKRGSAIQLKGIDDFIEKVVPALTSEFMQKPMFGFGTLGFLGPAASAVTGQKIVPPKMDPTQRSYLASVAFRNPRSEIANKRWRDLKGMDEHARWVGENLTEQAPQMAAFLSGAMGPRIATSLFLASMGAMQAGQTFTQNSQAGIDLQHNLLDSFVQGGTEVLSEMLPLEVFHKVQHIIAGLPVSARAAFIGKVLRAAGVGTAGALAQGGSEGLEEVVAQIGQNLSSHYIAGTDTKWSDGVTEAGILGALGGVAMGSPHIMAAMAHGLGQATPGAAKPGPSTAPAPNEQPRAAPPKPASESKSVLGGTEQGIEELLKPEGEQQPAPAATPAAPQKATKAEAKPLVFGNATSFSTERGAKLTGQYALAEAGDLIASHDEMLSTNPEYPKEMQPRDRTRDVSEMQISRIAQNLQPEFLGESPQASQGTPIVGSDRIVESGNARTIALKRAYGAGTAGHYVDWLKENAWRFGLTQAQVDGMKEPVLVRVRTTPVNRVEFARQANESGVAGMSTLEQARADAARLKHLDDLSTGEDGEITSAANRPFVRRFVNMLPVTEQGQLVTGSGELSQAGVTRIRNAILAKAYGGGSVLQRMIESPEENIRAIAAGLIRAAPRVAKAREAIDEGAMHDLDITGDLVKAVDWIARLRAQGKGVDEWLSQISFFEPEATPEFKALMTWLDRNGRSAKRVAEFVEAYLEAAKAAGSPAQDTMFGNQVPEKTALIERAAKGANGGEQGTEGRGGEAVGGAEGHRPAGGNAGAGPGGTQSQAGGEPGNAAGGRGGAEEGRVKGEEHAARTGQEQGRGQQEHRGAAPGADLRAHRGEVRPGAGEQAGRGDRSRQGGAQPQEEAPAAPNAAVQRGASREEGRQRVERRRNTEQRKRIAEMSPAEMRHALLTDHLTGLGNTRAYEEDKRLPAQVSVDLDSLKWVNDNLGHDSGDALIQAMGEAIREETDRGYRKGGDEFVVQAETPEKAAAVMAAVQSRLAEAELTFRLPDGSEVTKKGVDFSYGIGSTLQEADSALARHKAEREAAGQRAGRGEEPPGVRRRSAEGQQVGEGQAAEAGPVSGALFHRAGQPVFYSALARQVDAAKMASAPAQGWKDYIRGLTSKGVKAEEVEASGINDWLDLIQHVAGKNAQRDAFGPGELELLREHPGGRVTKNQVADFLAQNGVRVEETMLGNTNEPDAGTPSEWHDLVVKLDALGFDADYLTDDQTGVPEFRGVVKRSRAGGEAIFYTRVGMDPKPARVEWDIPASTKVVPMSEAPDAVRALARRMQEISDAPYHDFQQSRDEARYRKYTLPGGANYRELLLTLPTDKPANGARIVPYDAEEYGRASPGTRFVALSPGGRPVGFGATEAEAAEDGAIHTELRGGRVGTAEGVFQSSHFDQPNILAHVRFDDRTDAEGKKVLFIEEIQSDWAQKGKREGFAPRSGPSDEMVWVSARNGVHQEHQTEEAARTAAGPRGSIWSRLKGPQLPSAPFVGKTESWVRLALKRMIVYAAQHGYDRVAWTTGEQQAERYDLSKHVSKVVYTDLGTLKAFGTDGNLAVDQRNVPPEKLADYLGKDAADKLNGMEFSQPPSGTGEKVLSGLDLKVGGEGMRGFYDKIVPNVANDVLKKLGGGRVTSFRIKTGNAPEDVVARYPGNKAFQKANTPQPQPGFEITPAMRDAAAQGLPLFHRPGQGGDFKARLGDILTGKGQRDVPLELSDTPGPLTAIGLTQRPVWMTTDVAEKVFFDHGVPKSVIERLPDLLADPVMVFESDTVPGTYVVVTSEVVKGLPLVAAVKPETAIQRKVVNLISSAYPRVKPKEALTRWINDGLLRYVNTAKRPEWQRSTGLQLPKEMPRRGEGKTILTQDDVVKPGYRRFRIAGAGVDAALVHRVAAPIVGRIKGVELNVVADPSELPGDAPDDAQGMYWNGKLWLVASTLSSAGEVQWVAGHELGHFGWQSKYGNRLPRVALEMGRLNPELAAQAERIRAKFPEYSQATALGEALADRVAAGEASKLKGWDRFVAMVKIWMIERGFSRPFVNRLTSDEVALMTERVVKSMREGGGPRQVAPPVGDTYVLPPLETAGGRTQYALHEVRSFHRKGANESQADLFASPAGNVHPARAVSRAPKEKGHFLTQVEPEKIGEHRLAHETINTPQEAAHAFAELAKSPRERFLVLGLDKNNKPVAAFHLFSGTIDQTSVYPREIYSLVYSVPGIKKVWLAHNHPSGLAQPSQADELLTRSLSEGLSRDLGIGIAGHIIIAGDKAMAFDQDGTMERSFKIPEAARKYSVPILERTVRMAKEPGASLTSPGAVRDYLVAQKFDSPQLILLDSQHRVIGYYPMSVDEMQKLRTGNPKTGGGAIFRMIGLRNPAAAMYYTPHRIAPDDLSRRVSNLGALLAQADVKLLDGFGLPEAGNQVYSLAERGLETKAPQFYHRQGQTAASAGARGTLETPEVKRGYRAWAGRVVAAADRWLEPVGRLPEHEKYLVQRYKVLGRISRVDEIAGEIRKAFGDATPEDRQAVYDYLVTAGAKPDAIQEQAVREAAVATKRQINMVGDALVERGMLSAEARAQYRDGYLPRLYLKHLLTEQDFRRFGGGKKVSDMGYLKARKDIPEDIRKVILGEITDPGFLGATAISKPMRDMALLDWLTSISKEKSWILPQALVPWGDVNLTKPAATPDMFGGGGTVKQTRRVTAYWLKDEAARMRRQAEYYDPATAKRALDLALEMERRADAALGELKVDHKLYRQIPDTARYGHLRGMWVRKEIYEDIMGVNDFIPTEPGFFQKLFGYGGAGTKLTQLWKTGKVALNPPSQVRNFVSNGIMLQLSGVPLYRVPVRVMQAIHEVMDDGKHWKIAKKYGVKASTFVAQEMYRAKRELLDLERRMGNLSPLGKLHHVAAVIMETGGDFYQWMESVFKTAKIIDAMAGGMSEEKAVLEAQKWLFDYSLVSKEIRYLRNAPIGVPFLTWQMKVLPRMAEVALKHPWRFLPWAGLLYGMQYALASMYDVDREDLDKLKMALPDWLRERGHTMLLPYKDSRGRWQVLDLGYFFPWTQWTELARNIASGDLGEAVQTAGLFSGPITSLLVAIETGRDPFTDRDIWNAGDPPARQAMSILNYIWTMAAPPFLTSMGFTGHAIRAYTGETDRYGDPRSTPTQAALRLFGINLYALEPEQTRAANIAKQRSGIAAVKQAARYQLQDRSLTPKQRANITGEYRDEMQRRNAKLLDYIKNSGINPNLATGH